LTYDEAKDWIFDNLPDYVPPAPSIADFAKLMMPVIRNMPEHDLLADIVAVQPMQGPAAQIFYLDFVYKRPPWWKRLWKFIFKPG
jgi:hypothetical protein